jgi:hypothetical protein
MKQRLIKKILKSGRTSPRQPLSKKPMEFGKPELSARPPVVNYVPLVVAATYIRSRNVEYALPNTKDAPSGPTAEDIRWVIGQELLRLFVNGSNPETEKNIDALTTRIWNGQNDYSGTVSPYTIHFDGTRDRRSDILRVQPWIHAR